MVKRTLVVLGILSIMLTAGASFGGGCWTDSCGPCAPLFVPVPSPEICPQRAVKVWEMCIIGPCPPPACGVPSCDTGKTQKGLMSLCGVVASPCEVLFGGTGGVYGCLPKRDSIHAGGIPMALGLLARNCCCNYLMTGGPGRGFGCYW